MEIVFAYFYFLSFVYGKHFDKLKLFIIFAFSFKNDYKDGIGWSDAKNKLFNIVNNEIAPVREKYDSLVNDKNLLNDLLNEGSIRVRPIAQEMLSSIRDSIGIKKIS